jgi:hypothetical protein
MTRELALSLLRQGDNGSQIMQILDTLVEGIEQENISDAAAHYTAISSPTAETIQF